MLQGKILKLKAEINLAKGKTDQAIKRKGKKNLTERELLRRQLKTPEGKLILQGLKEQYSQMIGRPMEYILKERLKSLEHNKKLKFALLKELKYYKLKEFTPEPVKTLDTPFSTQRGSLGVQIKHILTIRDRAVLVLLNLVMESYMEPLGDPNSFGFRLGRDTQQAVSVVANRVGLDGCKNYLLPNLKVKHSKLSTASKIFAVNTQHIINVDAKEVLENVSYN